MNKTIKKKWVKALRSEKYKQGKEQLRSLDNEFCCLGVLCDITIPNLWKKTKNDYVVRAKETLDPKFETTPEKYCYGMLPAKLATKTGLNLDKQLALASMNDEGDDFVKIADWIEENL